MILIALCWIYSTGWSITPYFGFGRYIPEGILDSCSFDYLTRDSMVYAKILIILVRWVLMYNFAHFIDQGIWVVLVFLHVLHSPVLHRFLLLFHRSNDL